MMSEEVVDAADMLRRNRTGSAYLSTEGLDGTYIINVRRSEGFQSYRLTKFGVISLVDFAHAPTSNKADDVETVAKAVAGTESVRGRGRRSAAMCNEKRAIKESLNPPSCVQAAEKVSEIRIRGCQEGLLCVGVQSFGLGIQVLKLVPTFWRHAHFPISW
jgi:hypothetical protein